MTKWDNLTPEEKISLWRKFKTEIVNKSEQEKLQLTAQFWADLPFESRTIDYYAPETWMDPWEMLTYGRFCPSSISVMMYYTLLLTDVKNVELVILDDEREGEYLIVLVNNQSILNFELGKISNLHEIQTDTTVKILQKISSDKIKKVL